MRSTLVWSFTNSVKQPCSWPVQVSVCIYVSMCIYVQVCECKLSSAYKLTRCQAWKISDSPAFKGVTRSFTRPPTPFLTHPAQPFNPRTTKAERIRFTTHVYNFHYMFWTVWHTGLVLLLLVVQERYLEFLHLAKKKKK